MQGSLYSELLSYKPGISACSSYTSRLVPSHTIFYNEKEPVSSNDYEQTMDQATTSLWGSTWCIKIWRYQTEHGGGGEESWAIHSSSNAMYTSDVAQTSLISLIPMYNQHHNQLCILTKYMSIREHTHMQTNLLPQALDRLLKDGKQIENMKTRPWVTLFSFKSSACLHFVITWSLCIFS